MSRLLSSILCFFLGVAVCQSKPNGTAQPVAQDSTARPSASTEDPSGLKLPSDYRRFLAEFALEGYIRDAVGSPEITEPIVNNALFGRSVQVGVRFPVRAAASARENFLISADGPTRMRCIVGIAHSGALDLGKPRFLMRTPKIDPENCNSTITYKPFRELEQLAARVKTCETQGNANCLEQAILRRGAVQQNR